MKPIIPSPLKNTDHEFMTILTGSVFPMLYPMFRGRYVMNAKAIAVSVRVTSPPVMREVGLPIHKNAKNPPPKAVTIVKA